MSEDARLRDLGAAVAQLRQSHNASLDETAARAGLTPGALAEIERGEKDPSYLTLVDLAEAVPAPFVELLEGVDRIRAGRR